MIDQKVISGILAVFGASLCCITPVLAVLAGSTGIASTFSWLEPLRPYLITFTVSILAYSWWDKLKPKREDIKCPCGPDENAKVSFWHTTSFLALVTVFAAVILSFPYWGDALITNNKPKVVVADKANVFKSIVNIEGMTCKACAATVEKVAGEVDGVISIKASIQDKHAIIEFDKTRTDIKTIMKAIAATGYRPVSYEDDSGKHKVHGIEVTAHKIDLSKASKSNKASKCSGGKCGTGKCSTGKCK
jgi:copper chaperone CopZ